MHVTHASQLAALVVRRESRLLRRARAAARREFNRAVPAGSTAHRRVAGRRLSIGAVAVVATFCS